MKRATLLCLAAWALVGCGGAPAETTPSTTTITDTTTTTKPTTTGGCAAASADGISVASTDPYGGPAYALGYPPYALAGCSLAYVSEAGDLRLRDLEGGSERTLDPASAKPRRPALAGDLVAWEAMIGGKDVIRVDGPSGTVTLAGAFDHAREPRVAADAVVFTAWLGAGDAGDTDVLLYEPASGAMKLAAGGPGQQRFADVSLTHVAWTDFSEDPDGRFDGMDDISDIQVRDRLTGVTTGRKRAGKQAFPILGAEGKIAFLDWGLVHPEPKFSEYEVRLGPPAGDGSTDVVAAHILSHVLYLRPVAHGDHLSWVGDVALDGDPVLMRRRVDLLDPAETVTVFQGQTAFGPTAAGAITLVGATSAGGAVTLRAFTR